MKFWLRNNDFHSRKNVWKCRLEHGGHFVPASMCLKLTKKPGNIHFRKHDMPIDHKTLKHYNDVITSAMASQITSLTIVFFSIVYSGANQRKHQSSASLAFVRWIHLSPVFPAQMASNAKIVSIWFRHHDFGIMVDTPPQARYTYRPHKYKKVHVIYIDISYQ